jgi:hypothetical protein
MSTRNDYPRMTASEWAERCGSSTTVAMVHWREIANAERERGDRLECEIGDLRAEIRLLQAEAKSRSVVYVAKLKRCGVEARAGMEAR